eukprot:Protomagalhaensia_sp_Gyna_25__5856@NODE_877_length_2481_cov_19_479115_g691_i0_p4_GENE_NODE_877_length_2481_cov_19_479115_g691_i0NODE_877_length_2481_cov_19_479115_g691_i0_p4_ORF_typecomplete_len108_score7_62DC_STAMP/PF07782_13/0_08_NODE_877_length_2481_cov_19_479115_g691_i015861909
MSPDWWWFYVVMTIFSMGVLYLRCLIMARLQPATHKKIPPTQTTCFRVMSCVKPYQVKGKSRFKKASPKPKITKCVRFSDQVEVKHFYTDSEERAQFGVPWLGLGCQ